MDVQITIGNPILATGESFHIRYKLMPSGSWVDHGNETNSLFTITGLVAGDYELEITYQKGEEYDCPIVIETFTITEDPPEVFCTCPTVDEIYIEVGCEKVINLNIKFDAFPLNMGCKFRITYGDGTNDITTTYTTLPLHLIIPLINQYGNYVLIEMLCCPTQTWTVCYQSESRIETRDCECTALTITDDGSYPHPTIVGATIYWVQFTPGSNDYPPYYITFDNTINGGAPTILTSTVYTGGVHELTMMSGFISAGKYVTVVSSDCGSDQTNGVW